MVAHRTSPTNLGLYLLSVAAARDFGWIGMIETAERLEATLQTMDRLERFRGHFYNWYDTLDLRPLDPKYISSVDSGNLAGHLITLWNACGEMARHPVMGPQWLVGIGETLDLVRESARGAGGDPGSLARMRLDSALDSFAASLRQAPSTPVRIAGRLNELAHLAKKVTAAARALAEETRENPGTGAEVLAWADAVCASVLSHQRTLESLMPWAGLIARESAMVIPGGIDNKLTPLLGAMPTLADLPDLCSAAMSILARQRLKLADRPDPDGEDHSELEALIDGFKRSAQAAAAFEGRLVALGELARTMFDAIAFVFLFDPERELLSIGYRVEDGSLDPNYYDLLASEARLASFIAIAKGDVPTRHWFRLGRSLTPVGYGSALISWSGSMFEYLMPSLVMRAPTGSLIEATSRLVVRQQMKYGAMRGVPWGTSESAYNARDLEFTYQYSSFGIPDLSFKQGLVTNTVIAPYATGLAAMVDPQAAARNFMRLAEVGGRGRYGWYEALDYTKARLPEGMDVGIVRAYMAHHQGMIVIAIVNAVNDGAMRTRFHAEPIIQAAELLLQERMPRDVAITQDRDCGSRCQL